MNDSTLTEELSALTGVGGATARPTLIVVYGPDSSRIGARRPLPDAPVSGGELARLGRDAAGFIGGPLNDKRMSGAHAAVLPAEQAGDALRLRDLGSKNGTFLQGQRVDDCAWAEGDLVQVGRTFLTWRHEMPMPPSDPRSVLSGISSAMHALRQQVSEVAQHEQPVLILGPSGAGKEPTAIELHRCSGRKGPFVPVNCGALPAELIESELFGHVAGAFTGAQRASSGLFAAAQGGTLFLDEIGELPVDLQPKLLRVIQERAVRPVGSTAERRVDARVVAATHRDPVQLVRAGALRHDLYARLAGSLLRVPPLCEHRDDVPLLAQKALDEAAGPGLMLSAELVWAIWAHSWPLNVRALAQVVASSWPAAMGGQVPLTDAARALMDQQEDLADALVSDAASDEEADARAAPAERHRHPGREELLRLLQHHRGVVSRAARELGVHRYQFYRWLEKDGIDPESFRETNQ